MRFLAYCCLLAVVSGSFVSDFRPSAQTSFRSLEALSHLNDVSITPEWIVDQLFENVWQMRAASYLYPPLKPLTAEFARQAVDRYRQGISFDAALLDVYDSYVRTLPDQLEQVAKRFI